MISVSKNGSYSLFNEIRLAHLFHIPIIIENKERKNVFTTTSIYVGEWRKKRRRRKDIGVKSWVFGVIITYLSGNGSTKDTKLYYKPVALPIYILLRDITNSYKNIYIYTIYKQRIHSTLWGKLKIVYHSYTNLCLCAMQTHFFIGSILKDKIIDSIYSDKIIWISWFEYDMKFDIFIINSLSSITNW